MLNEWVGTWVTTPESEKDRIASELVRSAVRFTKRDSLISPVAVAVIDILGIRNLLKTRFLEDIAEQFAEPFYDLNGPAYKFGQGPLSAEELEREGFRRMAGIYPAKISDTTLLMRRPDWERGNVAIAEAEAVVWLAQYVCKVIRVNSLYGIWLRGAIAFGECIVNIGGEPACLGKPTDEASKWEKQQEWIGGMLTPSAVDALRRGAKAAKEINGEDFEPPYPNFLMEYPIPLKPNCESLGGPQVALNWITSLLPGAMWDAKLPPNDENGPNDVKRKVVNTMSFAEHCEDAPMTTTINW